MANVVEGPYEADIVVFEEDDRFSRDRVTVITPQNLAIGTVVGIITASGKVTILAPAAVDGSQTAAGVMIAAVDASAADKDGPMLARECTVKDKNLVWPGGISAGQKTTAIGQLKALGIVVRTTV